MPTLREMVTNGATLLDKELPTWWSEGETKIESLGFWMGSDTPLEQIFGDETGGRVTLFGPEYASPNLSTEQCVNLENHGFMLYKSPYTIHQLGWEWRQYIKERREGVKPNFFEQSEVHLEH